MGAPASTVPCDVTEQYEVIRAGWDTCVCSTDPPPIVDEQSRPGADLIRYRLCAAVRLRREHFGAIVRIGTSIRYLNTPAAAVLLACRTPKTTEQIAEQLGQSSASAELAQFLADCARYGWLESVAEDRPSAAALYFTEGSASSPTYLNAPVALEIELTNKCARHCSYCAYESGPNPKIQPEYELSTPEWLGIIHELADAGLMALEFTGGDPFVRQDALEIMRYADQRGITLLINSDLSILSQTHIKELAELKHLRAVQTSLDGATAESCDFTRGPGGFNLLLRQMEELRGAGLSFSIGTTLHRRNHGDVRGIAELIAARGATSFYIGPMYTAGRAATLGSLVVTPAEWDAAVGDYMAVIGAGVVAPADAIWHRIGVEPTGGNPAADQVYMTARGDRSLRIDPLGNCYVSAKLRQWHPRFWSLGNLRQMPLGAIWQGSRHLNELRAHPITANPFGGIDVRNVRAVDHSQAAISLQAEPPKGQA